MGRTDLSKVVKEEIIHWRYQKGSQCQQREREKEGKKKKQLNLRGEKKGLGVIIFI